MMKCRANSFQFELLLPPLHAVVHEVESSGLCGGPLLNLLHARCHCGVLELQVCMQRWGVKLEIFKYSLPSSVQAQCNEPQVVVIWFQVRKPI